MKKLLVLSLVLGIASMASAGFLISVDGVVDPEDTTIVLDYPSGTAIIDIHGTTHTDPSQTLKLVIEGPGSLDIANAVGWLQSTVLQSTPETGYDNWKAGLEGQFGYENITSMFDIVIQDTSEPFDPIPDGVVYDDILFHCDGEGDVRLSLINPDMPTEVFDTQIIHQIPEPVTMALLGLGALLLRRKK